MDLIAENLNVLLTLQVYLKFLDVFGGLVLGGQHAERDLDVEGFGRVDHGRMAFGAGLEWGVGFGGGQRDDFAAPAELLDYNLVLKNLDRGYGRELTPTTPQALIEEYLASISLTVAGTFAAVLGGAPVV
jgi:hypothetical protein